MTLLKIAAASGVMAVVVALAMGQLSSWVPGPGTGVQTFRLGVTIGAGLLAVAVSAKILGIPEFDEVLDRVRERLR